MSRFSHQLRSFLQRVNKNSVNDWKEETFVRHSGSGKNTMNFRGNLQNHFSSYFFPLPFPPFAPLPLAVLLFLSFADFLSSSGFLFAAGVTLERIEKSSTSKAQSEGNSIKYQREFKQDDYSREESIQSTLLFLSKSFLELFCSFTNTILAVRTSKEQESSQSKSLKTTQKIL